MEAARERSFFAVWAVSHQNAALINAMTAAQLARGGRRLS
jgi:hypothetical protein